VLGAARVAQKHYHAALAPLRDAVAIDAGFHNAWVNLGIALRHLNRPHEALAALRRAEQLRPGRPPTAQALVAVHCDLGEFDAARRLVAAVAEEPGRGWGARLRGWIELANALVTMDDAAGRRALAESAAEHFREALRQGASRSELRPQLAQVSALLHDDRPGTLNGLWATLAADPTDLPALRNAIRLLNAESVRAIDPDDLEAFLSALARHLAPGEPGVVGRSSATRASPDSQKER
jgi:tetratricopeptide (TPR) repeat protein